MTSETPSIPASSVDGQTLAAKLRVLVTQFQEAQTLPPSTRQTIYKKLAFEMHKEPLLRETLSLLLQDVNNNNKA
jgi:hypothetical protein